VTSIEIIERLQFTDGLIGYLDIRQWAFEKISASPVGSNLVDLRVHHQLFFTNLFGAIDLVRDHLSVREEKQAFEDQLKQSFPRPGDYPYARELRNSIVHRGLDPAMFGTQRGPFVFAGCPPVVHSLGGKKSYACSYTLLVDLAAACNAASNVAILSVIERKGLLDPARHMPGETETLDAIAESPHMPDWAKQMAEESINSMDFGSMAADLAQSRVRLLRSLLGAAPEPSP
jgi:hypothetical protein